MERSSDPRVRCPVGQPQHSWGRRLLVGCATLLMSACGSRSDPFLTGGPRARVEVVDAGADCPGGGSKIISGVDADGNGRLEDDEIESTSVDCDEVPGSGGRGPDGAGGMGSDGPGGSLGSGGEGGLLGTGGSPAAGGAPGVGGADDPGHRDSAIRSSREPMGANCARGGTRFEVGLDDGLPGGVPRNGVLEDEEVDSALTRYICNACIDLVVVGGDASPMSAVAQGIFAQEPDVFCGADVLNAESDALDVDSLRKYEALLIFNTNLNSFTDPAAVGNDMAAFFDDGGQVVVTLFADGGYQITGDWKAKQYNRLTHEWAILQTDSFTRSDPAQGLVADHPVLDGVNLLTGTGWIGPNVIMPGATAVAAYKSGSLLAAAGPVTDAQGRVRNRVDLNVHPEDILYGYWYGDGFRLLANALMYH